MFPLKLDQVEESKTQLEQPEGKKRLLCNLVKSKNYGNKNEYKGQEAIH